MYPEGQGVMRTVYIESPYAGDVGRNVAYALDATRDSLSRGESPFASHLLYTQMLDDGIADERRLGIAAGHAWARHADAIVFYVDLGWSRGMCAAREMYDASGVGYEIRTIR